MKEFLYPLEIIFLRICINNIILLVHFIQLLKSFKKMDELEFIKEKIKDKFEGNLIFYRPFVDLYPEHKEEYEKVIKNPIDLNQIYVNVKFI